MKRSIILLACITLVAVLFTGFSGSVNADKSDTCCQKFRIVSTGAPLSGCVVSIVSAGPPLLCYPDANLECEICGIPSGFTYTVEVNCDGERYGSNTFKACTDDFVIINVP